MQFRKTLLLSAVMMLSLSVFGQEVEPRLEQRLGKSKIMEIYNYRYSYYHFLTYELDHGFQVLSKKEISKDLKKSANDISVIKTGTNGNQFDILLLESKKQDFLAFDVNRKLDEDVVFKLDDGRYLVIFSKKKIARMYKDIHGEGKRTKPSKKK